MNCVIVNSVKIFEYRIEVKYSAEGEICKYLNYPNESVFFVEYTESVLDVPYGIAVIPFVANVLPICWLTDAQLILDELDEDFYESLFEVKHGYMMMYQMLDFLGGIKCDSIIRYNRNNSNKTACLFSGGVDAFATLFAHLDEKPYLITLLGSDIKLSDIQGLNNLKQKVNDVALNFGLQTPIYIKTNFRTFLKEGQLSQLVHKSGDLYWHGFQHGIGICSHVAPLNYKLGLSITYMASSFTYKYRGSCASDPIIESHLRFCGARVFHDRYSYTRQDKIRLIVSMCESLKKEVKLHVCWQSSGGDNCCKCEKCNRTILGILAEGANPKDYGFKNYDKSQLPKMKNMIDNACMESPFITFEWDLIKNRLMRNNQVKNDPYLCWICEIKRNKRNNLRRNIYRLLSRIYHKFERL